MFMHDHATLSPAPTDDQEFHEDKKDNNELSGPAGVKDIPSQLNVPVDGSNKDLETKLKDFVKNEVNKARQEFERQLQEEGRKRVKLEELVIKLAEQVQQSQARHLEAQLQ